MNKTLQSLSAGVALVVYTRLRRARQDILDAREDETAGAGRRLAATSPRS